MSVKSLLCLATVLCFGIVGCDDPEVEEKIANVLEHGAISAELDCSFVAPFSKPVVTISYTSLTYSAKKFIDGSCYATVCRGSAAIPTGSALAVKECTTGLYAKSNARSEDCSFLLPLSLIDTHPSYPYRPGVDGAHVWVSGGHLQGEFIENEFNDNSPNCGSGPGSCDEVEPWFSQDITGTECTGRNLEAFGASP